MKTFFYVILFAFAGFQMKAQTVVDLIVESPDHTTLEAAVIAAELADDLSGPGPFTVFAPTDAAFAALPMGVVDALLLDPTGQLATILLYHVLGDQVLSTDLSNGTMASTLQGDDITVTINGDGVFINDAMVTFADIPASNGVVHVIDAVLLPPVMPTNTIMDVVTISPDHTILEAALVASGLNGTLGEPGDFTLFAPTDAAFNMLPMGTIETLLADPNGALTNILLYHVLSGTVLSSVLMDGMMAMTINGADVTVSINANGVFINDAQVITADIMTDNGVVHVIDAVLLPPAPPTNTILDIVVNSADHNTLEAAVLAAGLQGALSGPGPLTVFAPTDAAFAALPAGTIAALLADPTGALTQILLYHAVGATALSTDLSDGQVIATLNGADVIVTINGGVFINDAQVIVADIIADNGVVHVIDAVLLPPAQPTNTILDIVVNSADHNTLEAAVLAAGLQSALAGPGPLTVFAPTDAAFAALPAGTIETLLADPTGALTQVLLYHAVAGATLSTALSNGMMITTLQGQNVTVTINANGVFINDAQVILADIVADNGVVHVIDAVLVPNLNPIPTTVVDIIVNSPDHTILETAVIAADLAETLSGDGPFTVFAPTDAAFAALPAGTIAALLADPAGLLTQILLYHVVGANALSTDLSDGQVIATLNGADVTVTINGGVFINDAQVIVADIIADNGVVHVIDAVLTPSSSVVESALNTTSLYPNPVSDLLTIRVPSMKGNTSFSVFNATGLLVSSGSFNSATNQISVDALAQGIYQVKLVSGNECVTRAFVKK